jgi:hypothetical protein
MLSWGDIENGSVMYVLFGYAPSFPLSNVSDLMNGSVSSTAVASTGNRNGIVYVFIAK